MSADAPRRSEAPSVAYGSGTWSALAADGLWLLVAREPGDPAIADAWGAVRTGHLDAVAETVRDGTLGGDFALVSADGGVLAVVVGGSGRVEATVGDRVDLYSCPPSVASTEFRLVGAPSRVRILGAEGAGGADLPLDAGVVPAGTLELEWSVGPEPDGGQAEAMPLRTVSAQAAVADDGPPQVGEIGGAATSEPVAVSRDTLLVPPDAGETRWSTLEGVAGERPDEPGRDSSGSGGATDGALTPIDEDLAGPGVASQGSDEGGEHAGYDFLFGHTVRRSVEEAAVHPPEEDAGPEADAVPGTEAGDGPGGVSAGVRDRVDAGAVAPLGSAEGAGAPRNPAPLRDPVARREPEPVVRADTTGMIDSVPWSPGGADVRRPPAGGDGSPGDGPTPTTDTGESDGDVTEEAGVDLTVSRSAQQALARKLEMEDAQALQGPSVHAVRCPSGHPNPTHADVCRVCGAPVADQSPVTLPRPVLGVLRFSTGDEITLDRGVLIGRRPTGTRTVGNDRPHIVKLPSPDQDLSRNHVEVRLDDWHVLITDLNSTNGTVVTQPGRAPERLRPDQATMIEPGTVVTLADVITFTFEATDRPS